MQNSNELRVGSTVSRARARPHGVILVVGAAMLCGMTLAPRSAMAQSQSERAIEKPVPALSPKEVGTRRVAVIDGLEVHYQDMGDPTAETIVFLHGAGGILSTGQVGPLLAKRYHVLIPSLPGFDDTPRGSNETLADAVEVMARFISQVSKPPVHVVGQSLGGRTASWLAVVHPELVRKLVLSAPATFESETPQLPADEQAAKKMLARMLLGSEAAADQIPSELLVRQRAMVGLLADYAKKPSHETLLARVGEISAPTLLLWGTRDTVLRSDGPAQFKKRVPGIQLKYIDAAHGLPVTNAKEYVEHTLAFLEGSAPASAKK